MLAQINLNLIDLAVFAGYMGVTVALGFWVARRGERTSKAYFLGSKPIPWCGGALCRRRHARQLFRRSFRADAAPFCAVRPARFARRLVYHFLRGHNGGLYHLRRIEIRRLDRFHANHYLALRGISGAGIGLAP